MKGHADLKGEVEQLFHEVADLSVEGRARYLDECGVAGITRRELEALLAFDGRTCLSLELDIAQVAEHAVDGLDSGGVTCGPYRLGPLLGRGGMGAVYLAERIDGEVTQRVAVKLLRAGMDDPRMRQQFLAERQILAGLSHPHVARMLDAGHLSLDSRTTDSACAHRDGQPWLAIEYVEGETLDVYGAQLTRHERIELFLKVCDAVSYLHRNLVVHRDLKPANILVTKDGQPKLLDFGIAKILDLTAGAGETSMRMLTPEYASPEQLAGRSVSTLTDVYSLGAVLYRLLTGEKPRNIDGDGSAETETRREGKFAPLSLVAPELRGDVEFIILKALRHDPQERYATVEQMAEDLESYLDNRPLRSRRDDRWYRARKLLRRYWVFPAAAAAVVASLASGLYIANRERTVAERRFAQLRQLSTKVIDVDRAIRTLPGSIDARRQLVAVSLEYLEGLSHETAGDAGLAMEVADGYWRMARIQGVNAEFNLGQHKQAEESLQKADRLTESVLTAGSQSRDALFRSALIAQDRMIVADSDGRRADSLMQARRSVERLEAFSRAASSGEPVRLAGFLRPGDPRDAERTGAALLYSNISLGFVNMHLYADGARYAQRSADMVKGIRSAADVSGQALSVLANALRYQGDLDGALVAIREARRVTENASYPSETAKFFNRYATIHREALILGEADTISLGRPDEAVVLLRQALDMAEEAAKRDAHDSASRGRVGSTARELGDILRDGDPAQALRIYDLGIRRLEEAGDGGNAPRERAVLLAKSSYPLRRLSRVAEARLRIDEAFAILKEKGSWPAKKIRPGSEAWTAMSARADFEAQVEGRQRAAQTWEKLLDAVDAGGNAALSDLRDAPNLSRMYAAIEDLESDPATAATAGVRRIELWTHWRQELPRSVFVRRQLEDARRDSGG
jgi:serine/threonine protein kinase